MNNQGTAGGYPTQNGISSGNGNTPVKKVLPPTALIQSITQSGEVTIKFSQDMVIVATGNKVIGDIITSKVITLSIAPNSG